MIKAILAVTFLVSTLSQAECLWLENNEWKKIHFETHFTCEELSKNQYPDKRFVDVLRGPGFKTLTFLKAGNVLETAVLSN